MLYAICHPLSAICYPREPMSAPLPSDPASLAVTFRPLERGDGPLLCAACWPERSAEEVAHTLAWLLRLADVGRAWSVVAAVDGQVIGFGRLSRLGRAAEISDLIVAPHARGHGVGAALIGHLIERARALDIERVEIGAAARNLRALALYRRLGFGEFRHAWLDLGNGPEEVIYLSRDLRADAIP
jgi:ribosomal protein S18 acetylase RimI-like enzyme